MLDSLTKVEPTDDGKTIKLSNIGWKEYNKFHDKLIDAGFILRDGLGDYFPGDDEKGTEGLFRVEGYKPKKK